MLALVLQSCGRPLSAIHAIDMRCSRPAPCAMLCHLERHPPFWVQQETPRSSRVRTPAHAGGRVCVGMLAHCIPDAWHRHPCSDSAGYYTISVKTKFRLFLACMQSVSLFSGLRVGCSQEKWEQLCGLAKRRSCPRRMCWFHVVVLDLYLTLPEAGVMSRTQEPRFETGVCITVL